MGVNNVGNVTAYNQLYEMPAAVKPANQEEKTVAPQEQPVQQETPIADALNTKAGVDAGQQNRFLLAQSLPGETAIAQATNQSGNKKQYGPIDIADQMRREGRTLTPQQLSQVLPAGTYELQSRRADSARPNPIPITANSVQQRLLPSARYDGSVYLATAKEADPNRTPVIFVNGINTDVSRSGIEALELSRIFRAPVKHVVNVSDLDQAQAISNPILRQRASDVGAAINGSRDRQIAQAIDEQKRTTLANPVASNSLASTVLNQLYDPNLQKRNEPIKIVAYSQGGAITTDALRRVIDHVNRDTSLKPEQRAAMFNRVRVLGIGPAAVHADMPQQFRNNYRIIYDRNDPIPSLAGVEGATGFERLTDLDRRSQDANFLTPHLSYFRHYEITDPGSTYNRQMERQLNLWYQGSARNQAVELDMNNPNFARERNFVR